MPLFRNLRRSISAWALAGSLILTVPLGLFGQFPSAAAATAGPTISQIVDPSSATTFTGIQDVSDDGANAWSVTSSANPGGTDALVQTNIATGAITVHADSSLDQSSAVSSDGTNVWIANTTYGSVSGCTAFCITKYNIASGTFSHIADDGTGTVFNSPTAVSSDGTNVWVYNAGSSGGFVSKINIASGQATTISNLTISADYPAHEVREISSDGTNVWVATNSVSGPTGNCANGCIVKINIASGAMAVISDISINEPDSVVTDGTNVWVTNNSADNTTYHCGDCVISRIDIASSQVTALPSGYVQDAYSVTSSGGVVYAGNYSGGYYPNLCPTVGSMTGSGGTGCMPIIDKATNAFSAIPGSGPNGFTNNGYNMVSADCTSGVYDAVQGVGLVLYTPAASAPSPVTAVTATANSNGAVTIAWAKPACTNFAPILSYTATLDNGASCSASAPATSCVITGLSTGVTYRAFVAASNAAGASGPSDPVTFTLPASATPSILAATGTDLSTPVVLATAFAGLGGLGIFAAQRRRRRA